MSLTNNRIKELRSLGQKKSREEQGLFIVEGLRLVQDATKSDFEILEAFYTPALAESVPGRPVVEGLQRRCPRAEQVRERDLDRVADTVTSQGILAVVRQKSETAEALLGRAAAHSLVVGLDAVADPGNLGSTVRACDWFGVDGILLGRGSVDLYNPKVVRATMGGIFHLPVVPGVDLPASLAQARDLGYAVYVTDAAGGTHPGEIRFAGRSVIVFGNEARGVSGPVRDCADERIAIRRYGAAESLNVAVACGIVLAFVRGQRPVIRTRL